MSRISRYIQDKRHQLIFAAVFLLGVCVHGSRIFTAYYFHDDAVMFGVGTTYTSGRWFLQALYKLQMLVMGSSINAKGFMGMAVLALFAVICCMLADGLGLKRKRDLLLLAGVVITFPYVPSILCYTYTAPHYCIAIIMSLAAALLMQGGDSLRQKLFRSAAGIVLLGLSMAVYQTTLCVFIAFLAVLAIKNSLDREGTEPWKSYFARCLRYLAGCILGCLFYYVSNAAVLRLKGFSMSGYQGLDHMEDITLGQFFSRAALAYKEFFLPSSSQNYSFYHEAPVRWCYWGIILMLAACAVFFLVRELRSRNFGKALQLLLLFCVLPLAIHSVFLTADTATTNIYSLMMFGGVMVFVCLIGALERLENAPGGGGKLFRNWGVLIPVILLSYMCVYFAYIANVCYTKAAIQQEQAIGYFNRLIVRIQMTEDYAPDKPVAYVYEINKNIESQPIGFIDSDGYSIAAYNYDSVINMYNWRDYMEMWCGFRAPEVSGEELQEYMHMPEVEAMPSYPYDGSVRVIDGVIVVKFDPY